MVEDVEVIDVGLNNGLVNCAQQVLKLGLLCLVEHTTAWSKLWLLIAKVAHVLSVDKGCFAPLNFFSAIKFFRLQPALWAYRR